MRSKARLVIAVVMSSTVVVVVAACGLDLVGSFNGTADGDGSAIDGGEEGGGGGEADGSDAADDGAPKKKRTCTSPGLQQNAVWPMLGGCSTHAGRSELRGPQTEPQTVWSATVSTYYPIPVIDAEGNVYVPADNDGVAVFGPDGGSRRMINPGGGNITNTPAIGVGGVLYVGLSVNVAGIFVDGGAWKVNVGGEVDSSPVLDKDGNVYAGSDSNKLSSFTRTGVFRWEYLTGGQVDSSPAIGPLAPHDIYVGSEDQRLHAVNAADGLERWHYDAGGRINSSPVVADDGTIYIGTNASPPKLIALTKDGALKWTFTAPGPFVWQLLPAIGWNGVIYAPAEDKLTALSPEDGGVLFTYNAKSTLLAPTIVDADGVIYVAGTNQLISAISPDGGKLWEVKLDHDIHGMAIGRNGWLYVTSSSDTIYGLHEK